MRHIRLRDVHPLSNVLLSSAAGLAKLTDGQLSLNGLLTLLDSGTALRVRPHLRADFAPGLYPLIAILLLYVALLRKSKKLLDSYWHVRHYPRREHRPTSENTERTIQATF